MHDFRAMNTDISTSGLHLRARQQAESWFAFVERHLSRFLPDSELSALNASAGQPFLASALLYQVLTDAHEYYLDTEGLFHPYQGKAIQRIGYTESFEKLKAQPMTIGTRRDEAEKADSPVQWDPGMKGIRLHPEAAVDLGGFAKGWAAHQFSIILQKEGVRTGAISAGGDIVCWGTEPDGWEIGVADPFHEEKDLLQLRLRQPAGVATSSTMKRRWKDRAGTTHHHIIDPRTEQSSQSNLVQVTVLAPKLVQAEVYAKCVLILGAEDGLQWLTDRYPDCAAIGVLADGTWIASGPVSHYLPEGGEYDERIS